jgi:PhnB protein
MKISPVPAGYHSVTPYLHVRGAARAIDFYARAFGATTLFTLPMPDGKLGHAEIKIGDSIVMLADEMPEMGILGPESLKGTATSLMIYVPNVDEAFARALKAGAKQQKPVEDRFYGDRMGQLTDPFGHSWALATHVEDVPPDELARRMAKLSGG